MFEKRLEVIRQVAVEPGDRIRARRTTGPLRREEPTMPAKPLGEQKLLPFLVLQPRGEAADAEDFVKRPAPGILEEAFAGEAELADATSRSITLARD